MAVLSSNASSLDARSSFTAALPENILQQELNRVEMIVD
jgi:hypothetical protein